MFIYGVDWVLLLGWAYRWRSLGLFSLLSCVSLQSPGPLQGWVIMSHFRAHGMAEYHTMLFFIFPIKKIITELELKVILKLVRYAKFCMNWVCVLLRHLHKVKSKAAFWALFIVIWHSMKTIKHDRSELYNINAIYGCLKCVAIFFLKNKTIIS